jgi:AcrR family transcriptional regulator
MSGSPAEVNDMTQPRATRTARRERTRAALIDAATALFHERGYGATTATDVAAAIGQTKGAFYFHFHNKEDCFLEVLRHRARLRGEWYRIPERLDPGTTSLDEILRTGMAELARSMDGRASFAVAMVDFWLEAAHRDEFAAVYDGWVSEITAFVTALQAGGWVDPALDGRDAATQMLALVDGLAIHARLYDTDTTAAAFDGLHELLTRGQPPRRQ